MTPATHSHSLSRHCFHTCTVPLAPVATPSVGFPAAAVGAGVGAVLLLAGVALVVVVAVMVLVYRRRQKSYTPGDLSNNDLALNPTYEG